ncbi:unnamed protein product [Clonostachys rosea]|uniref:AMP-dependent synthetase/ligase domain-containing protein n=1 Tax=Bionectria ochroleuca TaxID=29856 RepID=A0ABY6U6T6_BIOOC|nr:unnamed protein product [Clonostachys rosea]
MALPNISPKLAIDGATLAEIAEACHITVSQIEEIYPCLPQQISQIDDKRSEQFQILVNFGPDADIDGWCDALRQVVAVNSTLRTRIVKSRVGIVQVVTTERHQTGIRTGEDLEQYVKDGEQRLLGFGDLLFRSVVIDRTFIAIIHHAIMDHSSISTLLKEDVSRVFFGQDINQRPAYRDFVHYNLDIDESAARSFWASRFKGQSAIYPPVPVGHDPYPYGVATKTMPLDLERTGISPAHVPLYIEAAWALTAATYSNSDNVAYGLVLSGRSPSAHGLEKTLGQTVVEIPVQVHLKRNMTIEQLVKDRATSLRKLQAEPSIQFGLNGIASVSDAARTAAGFQTQLNIIPSPRTMSDKRSTPKNGDIEMDRIVWMAKGAFSLMLPCYVGPGQVFVEAKYDPVCIPERQVHRVLNQFDHILQRLLVAPMNLKLHQLPLFSSDDMAEVTQWNKILPKPAEKLIYDDFVLNSHLRPNIQAVEATDGHASYGELHQLSDNFADELQRRGISSGEPVLLTMDRSLSAIIAIIGIIKAGGICVPVYTQDSLNQKTFLAASVKARMALSSTSICSLLEGVVPDVLPIDMSFIYGLPMSNRSGKDLATSPEDPVFILSTNGSMLGPKDVVADHRSLASNLSAICSRLDWYSSTRILQFASLASAASIYEVFGALSLGKCLCIPPETADINQTELADFISSFNVDTALLPPSIFRNIKPDRVTCLKSLTFFGESIDDGTLASWSKATRLFNSWGVCEASMLNTVNELAVSSSRSGNIGRPVGCAVWIVNPSNTDELAPIGSIGELLIEGPSVSRGYLNSESKTKASFILPPKWASDFGRKSARFHRTGDLGKYAADGTITFVGKKENAVKVGPHTIQLEALENLLLACSEVQDIVTCVKIAAGRTQLFAILSLTDTELPSLKVLQELPEAYTGVVNSHINSIRTYAEENVSCNKMPDSWIVVEKLPRTGSFRLNRGAVRSWLKTNRR